LHDPDGSVLTIFLQSLRTRFANLMHISCAALRSSDFSPDGPHAVKATTRASVGASFIESDVTAKQEFCQPSLGSGVRGCSGLVG